MIRKYVSGQMVPLYSICGQCTYRDHKYWINHIAVVSRTPSSGGGTLRVAHMAPPLEENSLLLHFWLDIPLSEIEKDGIRYALKDTEWDPPSDAHQDMFTRFKVIPWNEDGHNFSCAGFVVYLYSFAGIRLISEETPLPQYTEQELGSVWPIAQAASLCKQPYAAFKERIGLFGEGPWSVLMPGAVIQSARVFRKLKDSYVPKYEDAWLSDEDAVRLDFYP